MILEKIAESISALLRLPVFNETISIIIEAPCIVDEKN